MQGFGQVTEKRVVCFVCALDEEPVEKPFVLLIGKLFGVDVKLAAHPDRLQLVPVELPVGSGAGIDGNLLQLVKVGLDKQVLAGQGLFTHGRGPT